MTTIFSKFIRRLMLVMLAFPLTIQAIEVALPPPHFAFELNNINTNNDEHKLAPEEHQLAKKLKPLLDNQQYLSVIELLSKHNASTKSVALQLIEGQVYLAQKQHKQAEKALLNVLKEAPNLLRVHKTLAALYLQNKQLDKAQHHLIKAIEQGVQDPQFFGQLAYIHLDNNSPWSAIAGYQQALLLDPHNLQWRYGLLHALQRAGNYQAALNMVDELLNKTPKNKKLWLQRAQINLANNQQQKALSSMEMALRYGEENDANLLSTAQLHLTNGSVTRASDLLIQLTKKRPQAFLDIHGAINWLLNEGKTQQAKRVLASIKHVKQLPKNQQSLYYAALGTAIENSQEEQAIKHYQRAIKLDPNQSPVLLKLAQYYQDKQQYSRAEIYYQRAQVFKTSTRSALAGLAQVALDQQHYNKALKYLEQLKPLSRNQLNIEKNIATLKRMLAQKSG